MRFMRQQRNNKIKNRYLMILAIATETNKPDTAISRTFGRGNFFMLYNTETRHVAFIENRHRKDEYYVGENITDMLIENKVQQFIAYDAGLKIQQKAFANNIQIILIPPIIKSIKDILKLIESNNQ